MTFQDFDVYIPGFTIPIRWGFFYDMNHVQIKLRIERIQDFWTTHPVVIFREYRELKARAD